MVAHQYFGSDIALLERDTFPEVFNDTLHGEADYGIIAIENSIAGSILENYDRLLQNEVYIIGESYLRIAHQLMTLPGTSLEDINEVWSHPMAIKQCYDFLHQHDWKVLEKDDTAGSAKEIKEHNLIHTAAIASTLAAELYGLDIIAKDIESHEQNYTRFLILSNNPNYSTNANKTSIVFETNHTPGSLAAVTNLFAEQQINLTKVESRPIVGDVWKYYFYLDFEAGIQEDKTQKVIEQLQEHVNWMKILGSYEHGELM